MSISICNAEDQSVYLLSYVLVTLTKVNEIRRLKNRSQCDFSSGNISNRSFVFSFVSYNTTLVRQLSYFYKTAANRAARSIWLNLRLYGDNEHDDVILVFVPDKLVIFVIFPSIRNDQLPVCMYLDLSCFISI